MKNVLPAVSFLLLFSTAAIAQDDVASVTKKEAKHEKREMKRSNKGVSAQSKQQFMQDFAAVNNVSWKATENFDEATFINNNVNTTAYYDFESNLVGTTTPKVFSDLPSNAQEYIKTHYKDYKANGVILFDDNEVNETDMVLYGTSFEDEDNYFVLLKSNKETIILKVNMNGEVSYFKKL